MDNQVLILGTTPAGLQAAADLADLGLQVHLLETSPFIGGQMPGVQENSQQLEILKHPQIKVWTSTELVELKAVNGAFQAEIRQDPRYIDLDKCTACGDCLEVCPVTIPGSDQKAIYFGGQPGCAAIAKSGISPCSKACPAGIHVQGYAALIRQGRYREAYELILDALPFPSVCGRVCNHYCEQACTRANVDQAVSLMALKRFAADWASQHPDQIKAAGDLPARQATGKKVAVVGAGPSGLTAARDLVRLGHEVTVFDDNPVAGGMMRVGIPPHRLPYQHLEWEIERILAEGVELRLNTWVDDIPGLLGTDFDAVLIATGAHQAVKVDLEGSEHPDNWLSLDFLKKICLGEKVDLTGRKVIVLGGGDVAMDAARSAIRLGTSQVSIVCRGLRASFNEIMEAEEEGVEFLKNRVFQRVVISKGAIQGVECLEAEVGDVVDGKRQFEVIPGTEHLVPGDLVIWAVGQKPDFSFLPEDGSVSLQPKQGIQAEHGMMTSLPGVFTAGDVHRGTTFFVVDAVGEGHQAAVSIDHFLNGLPPTIHEMEHREVVLELEEIGERMTWLDNGGVARAEIPKLPAKKRAGNFMEVELTLTEEEILREADRCLVCGPCSQCMACVDACQPGAVIHQQTPLSRILQVSSVIGDGERQASLAAPGWILLESAEPQAGSAAAYRALESSGMVPGGIADQPQLWQTQPAAAEPRTGLILCQCGGSISDAIDTAALGADALSWPGIVYSTELPFCCTDQGTGSIREIAREQDLDRIVLAACSCCSLDQVCFSCTYQRTRSRGSLGIFSPCPGIPNLEFVNIREQCAWAHPRSRKKATSAARRLIRAALFRKSSSRNAQPASAKLPGHALILGNSESGKICQEALIGFGLTADQVEILGGEVIRSGGKYLADWPEGNYWGDILVLAPGSGAELDHISRAVTLADGTALLRGSDPDRNLGLFICTPELDPRPSGEGCAAAIGAWVSRLSDRASQPAAVVDPARCRACGTCSEVCGYGVPLLISDQIPARADINPLLCFDCGACAAHCPSGAITPGSLTAGELEGILDMMLE